MIAWGCKNARPDFSDLDVSHNAMTLSTFTHFCAAFRDNEAISLLRISQHSPYAKRKPLLLSRPLSGPTTQIIDAIPSDFESHQSHWPSFSGFTLKIPVMPEASPMQVDDAPVELARETVATLKVVSKREARSSKYPDDLAGLSRNERRKHLLPWPQKCAACGFVWAAGSVSISKCETYRSMCKLHNRPCAERSISLSVSA